MTLILLLGTNNLSLAAPIQVDIKYLYYRNGWDNYKTLKNGSVLYREKDFIKIIFTPSQRAYVYIFAKGSSANIYRIFPMQAFKGINRQQLQSGISRRGLPHPQKRQSV
ncbi:MAG: hypothetical protein ABFS56_26455 [Pseudomonadota bacterium]